MLNTPCKNLGCHRPPLHGLESWARLCQYHYDEYMWGTEWADKSKEERERRTADDNPQSSVLDSD